jgi:hypothetical protein
LAFRGKSGISCLSVRQVVSQLVQEGFLIRRRGEGKPDWLKRARLEKTNQGANAVESNLNRAEEGDDD